MNKNHQTIGYLPDETPSLPKLLLYALQQVIVMFPATVAVAIITGFHISTTIFASGLATLCFLLITGRKIPLYYGSSFSYVAAIVGLMSSDASPVMSLMINCHCSIWYSNVGLISIAAGFIVNRFGRSLLKNPPSSRYRPHSHGHRPDPCRQCHAVCIFHFN